MKLIDLRTPYLTNKEAIDAAIHRVLDHGQYILGPEVQQLERVLAERIGVAEVVTTSSGTTALGLALMALGVGPGDEVITSGFSFFATAEVIALLGAKPVLVDIDAQTYNIDPTLIEAAITSKTKVIMPVSMFGQPADFTAINSIAERHGLAVIEDGAQSFGSEQHGRCSGNLSTIGCTSFFPSKPLGCYGDGGACFTNDLKLAQRMRSLANHGQESRYYHTMLGLNGRLDTIQAAVLLQKLALFSDEVASRQQVAQWYGSLLADTMELPVVLQGNRSVYAQYTIQVDNRDEVQAALAEQGIPTAVHYPKGLHHQPALRPFLDQVVSLPVTERVAARVLSLPFYPSMTEEQVRQVAAAVNAQLAVGVEA